MFRFSILLMTLFSLLWQTGRAVAAPPAAGGREIFVVVARPEERLALAVRREVIKLIAACSPGDVLHVIVAPQLAHLATITVPQATGAARLRQQSLRTPLAALATLGRKESSPEGSQLSLPAVAAVVQSLRKSQGSTHVILVGDCLYNDPRQGHWSMKGGVVPADGSLDNKQSPFSAGVMDFPENTRVSWLALSADWGSDHAHREAVTRFYRLFFAKHKAELVRVTSDPATAFSLTGPSQFTGAVTPQKDGDGMKAVWIHSTRKLVPAGTPDAIPLAPGGDYSEFDDAARDNSSDDKPK